MKCVALVISVLLAGLIVTGCGRAPSAHGKKLQDWVEVLKRSNNPQELIAAANALAELGPQAEPAAWEIVRLLGDRQWFGHYRNLNPQQVDEVFAAFGKTVRAVGPPVAPIVIQALEVDRPVSRDVVGALSPEAITEFAKGLDHAEPKVRAAVAKLLGDLGHAAASSTAGLIKATGDADYSVRRAAAKALGLVATDAGMAEPVLLERLNDANLWVRVAAIEGLQALRVRDAAAVTALIGRLADPDPVVRGAAVLAVADLGEAAGPAVSALIKVVADPEPENRRKAVATLGRIAPMPVEAARALVVLLDDASLAGAATQALKAQGANAAPALPVLAEVMRRRGFRENPAFAEVLTGIGPAALPVLRELLVYRVPVTDSAFSTNPDEGWPARSIAATALGGLGSRAKEAVPTLREALQTERNATVVKAIHDAIRRIQAAQ
jgi:HEAT repeat protein